MRFAWLAALLAALGNPALAAEPPQLKPQGTAMQLHVDGKPFLILGGELGNSTASELEHLKTHWKTLRTIGLNTVVAPVEWDQIEPGAEGRFDWRPVDGLLRQAEASGMKLVLLWFGAWKNSMSTYVPPYVKHDSARFVRAQDDKLVPQDILSPYGAETLKADQRAFSALMAHLKATDRRHTVLMVQVENEIGMLPSARDHGPLAEAAWREPVPAPLMAYLQQHRAQLHPYVREAWAANGQRSEGRWAEVFGEGLDGQEIFQAWGFARFAEELARAGKAAYAIPMYVNVALNRPGKKPGEYPSAGPLPHLFDIWKAAAPSLDFIGLDIYFPNFVHWADQFKRADNPVFIPEAHNAGRSDAGANAFYTFGQLDGIGFSPFSIENLPDPANDRLTKAYATLKQLTPLILAHQGKGTMRGFKPPLSYEGAVDERPQSFVLGRYRFTVNYVERWTPREKQDVAAHGGLIVMTGPDEFVVAGSGVTLTFEDAGPGAERVGIEQVLEGRYDAQGRWRPGRWLNGDQTHQGRHLQLPVSGFGIQRLRLYRY